MKKKQFSWMPQSSCLRNLMQSCFGLLAINWCFQGMRGMQIKELSFRLLLESLAIIWIYFSLPHSLSLWERLFVSLLGAHTLNWLFNGQLWVCVRYCSFYHRKTEALQDFLRETEKRLQSLPWLQEAVCIGSVGNKGSVYSERSDIDLRLIFPTGKLHWLLINLLLLRLRVTALFLVIPLDLYAYNSLSALDRFRQDEHLHLILDRQGLIANRYSGRIRNIV